MRPTLGRNGASRVRQVGRSETGRWLAIRGWGARGQLASRRRSAVATGVALLVLAACLCLAGCGSPSVTAGGSSISHAKTYASQQFGYSITYDGEKLSRVESTHGDTLMGPTRPHDWVGLYVRNLLYTVTAEKSGVLNIGLCDRSHPPNGLFITASTRDPHYTVAYAIASLGPGMDAAFHGRQILGEMSPSAPPGVTIGALHGFKVTTTQRGTNYVFYVLFGKERQYAICLFGPKTTWAAISGTLEDAVRTFRSNDKAN
jgi:hypothetical protein